MLDNTQTVVAITGSGIAILAALGGWLKYIRPKLKKKTNAVWGAVETLAGRDAIVNRATGRVMVPAVPGIGIRMENLETKTDELTSVVKSLAKTHAVLDNHEQRIQRLEEAAVERVVTKAESAAAWRAIASIAHEPDADEPSDFTD